MKVKIGGRVEAERCECKSCNLGMRKMFFLVVFRENTKKMIVSATHIKQTLKMNSVHSIRRIHCVKGLWTF